MRRGMAWHTWQSLQREGSLRAPCPMRHGMQGVPAQSSVPMHWGRAFVRSWRGGTAPPGMLCCISFLQRSPGCLGRVHDALTLKCLKVIVMRLGWACKRNKHAVFLHG